jgi:hypothetical protein
LKVFKVTLLIIIILGIVTAYALINLISAYHQGGSVSNNIIRAVILSGSQEQTYRFIITMLFLSIAITAYIFQYWWYITDRRDKQYIKSFSKDLYPLKHDQWKK